MKRLSLVTTAIATAIITFSGFTAAGDIEGELLDAVAPVYQDGSLNGVEIDISGIGSIIQDAKAAKKEGALSAVSRAPATGISYFEVFAVGSSNIGWEDAIPAFQTTTTYNHGGAAMRVAVLQIGLGNANNGTMGGSSVSPYYTRLLCGSDLHDCSAGETITGYLRYYSFDGQQGGFFSNSANLTASPFGFWSDSMTIL